MHPSMVAHQGRWARIVVQIDTQQLPSAVTASTTARRNKRSRGCQQRCHHLRIGGSAWVGSRREGHQIFTDELTRFAERTGDPRITPLIDRRIAGPLRVAVRGRDGVGRGTVATALAEQRCRVVQPTHGRRCARRGRRRGAQARGPWRCSGGDRPIAGACSTRRTWPVSEQAARSRGADRRAADYRALTGVPTVPMVGLLAAATLDDELVAALRMLSRRARRPDVHRRVRGRAAQPAPRCPATAAGHPRPVRHRPRRSGAATKVRTPMRCLRCCVGSARSTACVAQLDAAAPRSATGGCARRWSNCDSLAVQSGDERWPSSCGDDAVIGVMAAAVDVVRGGRADGRPRRRRRPHICDRAMHWHRYSRGPVNALHRSCGADIAAGLAAVCCGGAVTDVDRWPIRSPRWTRWWPGPIPG